MGLKYHCDLCDEVVTESSNKIEIEFKNHEYPRLNARGYIDVVGVSGKSWICHKCTVEKLCLPENLNFPLINLIKILKG